MMKILSLRLHPFGGTTERTCDLREGLNVLEGPNEFGKSTLAHALWSALFIPTNLTPAKLRTKMDRWGPRPSGDHLSVTLRFRAEDRDWTLTKSWGAGAASRLQAEGEAALADPDAVQRKLDELRKWNEATWSCVLFATQAELADTVKKLREAAHDMDDVHGLLAGAAAIPGDIPGDRLRGVLEDRITRHFGRWDRTTEGPEGGRGIDNPWQNKLGPVVEAWYAAERLRRTLAAVKTHEAAVDALNARIQELTKQVDADRPFVEQGRRLRDGLSKRGTLEEKRERLTGTEKQLMEIVTAWPGAEQVMQGKEGEHARLGETLKRLQVELGHAQDRARGQDQRKRYAALLEARKRWQAAAAAVGEAGAIDPDALSELRKVERHLDALRIQIAAQKLSATLESTAPLTVTLERGAEAPEEIELTPERGWEGEAAGRIRIQAHGLRIGVRSGQEDVDALFARQEKGIARRAELLEALGQESLEAAEAAFSARTGLVNEEATGKRLVEAALEDRTQEEWEADIAKLDALPETRALDALEKERAELLARRAGLEAELRQVREKVEVWEREHTDVPTLMEKVLAVRAELAKAAGELAELPELPEGFASTESYLRVLSKKEQSQEGAREGLAEARREHDKQMGQAPERSAEDLEAELDRAVREFERQRAEGEALLRIRAALERILEARGTDDPLAGLAQAVSRHFSDLTEGRYPEVALEGTAPARVGGELALPTTHLSQGTMGSLALATRLALAELYLGESGGFLMVDDPFIDMDPERRAAAARVVGAFAKKRQVIYFTCHPNHTEELRKLGGGERVKVS